MKTTMVGIRVTQKELELFHELGRRLNRTYSDATRLVVKQAVEILREKETEKESTPQSDKNL